MRESPWFGARAGLIEPTLMKTRAWVCGLALAVAACSGSSGGDSPAGSGGASASGGSGPATSGGSGPGPSGGGPTSTTSPVGVPFAYGVNFGYRDGMPDAKGLGQLSFDAGVRSSRPKFHESELAMDWGPGVPPYGVEKGKLDDEKAAGVTNCVGFLIGVTADHSTAPAGSSDYDLEQHIPKNLDQPIWKADGTINEDNYWGYFVWMVVNVYHDDVKVWEIWNEPDWVADSTNTPPKWATQAPTAAELVRFGGNVFDYVRMLRIATEVAKKADPDAKIALGGIGYETFLDAVLRYTDAPDGSIDADHPKTGADYFDVVSFHYYPLFSNAAMADSDAGADEFVGRKKVYEQVLAAHQVTGKTFVVTETGAPTAKQANGGGEQWARNYLMKSLVRAQMESIYSVQWFDLTNDDDDPSDAFSTMGLYEDLKNTKAEDAKRTTLGDAYRTIGLLADATYDPALTQALALPAAAQGAVFTFADGHHGYALWARTTGRDESVSTGYTIPTARAVTAYTWQYGRDGSSTPIQPVGGAVAVKLGGDPQIFIEQ